MRIGARESWRPWVVVALLFGAQTINRADKIVLGLAATAIMAELHISAAQYGLVASSFYTLYAAGGLLVGLLFAHRYRPRWILAVLMAAWALAQLPVIIGASFGALIASRMLLGIGEGNGTPTCINACHEWFPSDRRNMPTAIVVVVAASVGSLVSAPALSIIIQHYGWRAAFAVCALLGVAVLVLWLLLARDGPYVGIAARNAGEKTATPRAAGALRYLRDPSVYGSFILGVCSDWVVGFSVAWLAPFLSLQLGYTRVQTGWLFSLIFLALAVLVLAVSAASQKLIRRGASTRVSRAVLNGVCLLIAVPCFVVAAFAGSAYIRLVAVGAAVGLPQITFSLNPPLLTEVFPPEHRNRLLHTVMAGLTVGSLISPWATGMLIEHAGKNGWTIALLLNGAITLIGAVAALVLINPERSVDRLRSQAASQLSLQPPSPAIPIARRM